jgi:hypothetical protein
VAFAASIGGAITVVGLGHVVQIHRGVERELFVAVYVDHGSLAQRRLQPDTHRAVAVMVGWEPAVAVPLAVDQHTHVDLVLELLDDDLTHAALAAPERDSKLEFTDTAFTEA